MRGDQRGFTLVELLSAMLLMIIILSATLLLFQGFERSNRIESTRTDTQDRTRTALDRLAHDLRNLAGSSPGQPVINKASDYDLVFLTVNPVGPNTGQNAANVQRVRYCLDNTNPANEVLWSQVQTWTTLGTPAVPDTSACPSNDTNWNGGNRVGVGAPTGGVNVPAGTDAVLVCYGERTQARALSDKRCASASLRAVVATVTVAPGPCGPRIPGARRLALVAVAVARPRARPLARWAASTAVVGAVAIAPLAVNRTGVRDSKASSSLRTSYRNREGGAAGQPGTIVISYTTQ